jgi:hypothetical protein
MEEKMKEYKKICKNCQKWGYITNPRNTNELARFPDIIGCELKNCKVKVNDTCENWELSYNLSEE